MSKIIAAIVLMMSLFPASAEPWVVYGQTMLYPERPVQNPAPNVNGLLGEVRQLPYVVPAGKVLIIRAIGMEGLWGGAIIPWIGEGPHTAANSLMTVNSNNVLPQSVGNIVRSFMDTGFAYHLPAGTKLNIRLSATHTEGRAGWIFGWYVGGELIDR